MTKLDKTIIVLNGVAAILCILESGVAPFVFIAAMILGLRDAVKKRFLYGGIINTIFLLLNIYNAVHLFV